MRVQESSDCVRFPSLTLNFLQSINSSMGVGMSACARAVCPSPSAAAAASPRSCTSLAVVASAAHALVSPLHSNSWSDTVSSQGPRERKRVKEGVTGPAEDLRPVSEVEAGVNFRPAGGVRGQVEGSLPRRQPGIGTRRHREGAVTPGGSWYPIRVTWSWTGHQAINGLDEGV